MTFELIMKVTHLCCSGGNFPFGRDFDFSRDLIRAAVQSLEIWKRLSSEWRSIELN